MRNKASPSAIDAPADSVVLVPGALEAVIQALAGVLTSGHAQSTRSADATAGRPLLGLEETAELLGVSRTAIARMADEGRLPSVVVRRGRVQKTRRIPRAFVDRMVADACAGAQVDMEGYAASWLAEHAEVPSGAAQDAEQEHDACMTARSSAGEPATSTSARRDCLQIMYIRRLIHKS
jgi:excisionase family DNA binding protein